MSIYDLFLIGFFLGVFIVQEALHARERAQLLNRLMARDYAQYRYFEDKWQGDLKEVDRIREEGRTEKKPEEEATPVDLSKFDEAWEEEDK